MHPYLSNMLMADRQRELRRQADNWRLFRGPRRSATASRPRAEWRLQSPIVRRPVPRTAPTACG